MRARGLVAPQSSWQPWHVGARKETQLGQGPAPSLCAPTPSSHVMVSLPPPAVFTPWVIGMAVARYNFVAQDMQELSLREGDVVKIYSRIGRDQGWWKGETNGWVSEPAQSPPPTPTKRPRDPFSGFAQARVSLGRVLLSPVHGGN